MIVIYALGSIGTYGLSVAGLSTLSLATSATPVNARRRFRRQRAFRGFGIWAVRATAPPPVLPPPAQAWHLLLLVGVASRSLDPIDVWRRPSLGGEGHLLSLSVPPRSLSPLSSCSAMSSFAAVKPCSTMLVSASIFF